MSEEERVMTFEQYRENMSVTRPAQPGGDDSSAGQNKREVKT
jgi:hypothetical protein